MVEKTKNRDLPAFASVAISGINSYQQDGLTKREYFAGLALQGLLSDCPRNILTVKGIVESAINYADTLLDELEK